MDNKLRETVAKEVCVTLYGEDLFDDVMISPSERQRCFRGADAAIKAVLEAMKAAEMNMAHPPEMLDDESHIKMLTGELNKRQMAMIIIAGRKKAYHRQALSTYQGEVK